MSRGLHFQPNDPRLGAMARKQTERILSETYGNRPVVSAKPEPFELPRYRSKAEEEYAARLTVLCRVDGSEIRSFLYEAIRLRVGEQNGKPYWYVPDFLVIKDYGQELHEIKGIHKGRERGLAKFRAAQLLYPWWKFVLIEA